MANKFQKAIQNRSSEILDAGKNTNTKSNTIKNNENMVTFDLNSILEKDELKFKNKSYYLETNVINDIKKVAKKQKISESKLVNNILKKILDITK